jgi:hypothetical protein
MATVQTTQLVHRIVTHEKLHLDEAGAIRVLCEYGKNCFPGIENAKIEVFNPYNTHDVVTKNEEDWLREGYLFIGVGGKNWSFVDHPHEDHPDECAFTMVLKYLGFDEDPVWQQLGKEVLREDRNGASTALHIASLIKAANEYMDPEEAAVKIPEMVDFFLLGAYRKKQEAFQAALREQEDDRVSKVTEVENVESRSTNSLAVVLSDNSESAVAARFLGAILVVHVRNVGLPNQQIYISCNKAEGLRNIGWLVSQIRREEHKKQIGVDFEERPYTEMASDGELFEWYHQERAGALFWGSRTAKRVFATKVSIERISELAIEFLGSTRGIKSKRRK